LKSFNCGNATLDAWLQNTARQHQQKNLSRTFVLVQEELPTAVVGYYSLAIRGLTFTEMLPQSMRKAFPSKVSSITLARLAVATQEQKKGHGELLLLDAMAQAKIAASLIGGSFLFVDVKGSELADFYGRYGFVALPDDPLTLCMLISDIP
jgi:predicted GNAT family N-acyltransferase